MVPLLFSEPITEFIFPLQPEIHVTNFNAEYGVVEGSFPNYVYSPRSYPENGIFDEIFHITITNDNDAIANNFLILFSWEPKESWLNYNDTKISNSVLSDVCPKKSSQCFFESVSKQLSPIQLSYKVTFDIIELEKSNNDSKILLTFQYDEISETVPIIIDIKID